MSRTTGFFRSRHGWQRPSRHIRHKRFSGCFPPSSLWSLRTVRASLSRSGVFAPQRSVGRSAKNGGSRLAVIARQPRLVSSLPYLKGRVACRGGQSASKLSICSIRLSQVPVPDMPELKAGYLYVRGYALSWLRAKSGSQISFGKGARRCGGRSPGAVQSTVLVRLGTVLFSLGDRAKAEECYTSALAQADAARDSYLQARAHEALGYLDLNNSRYDECAIWSARALHTYQTLGAEIRHRFGVGQSRLVRLSPGQPRGGPGVVCQRAAALYQTQASGAR